MARDTDSIDLIAQVPLFSACSSSQLKRVARLGEQLDAEPDQRLTEEGARGSEFYVIQSGRAKVSLDGRKLGELGDGDFFGEMALLDQGPRAATVTALSPMRLLRFDADSFGELLDSTPGFGKQILRGLAKRLREANRNRISPHD